MTYDNWKSTNPADEWLGPDPRQTEMPFEETYYMRLMSLQHVKDETDVQRQKRILSQLLEDIREDIRRIMTYDS